MILKIGSTIGFTFGYGWPGFDGLGKYKDTPKASLWGRGKELCPFIAGFNFQCTRYTGRSQSRSKKIKVINYYY